MTKRIHIRRAVEEDIPLIVQFNQDMAWETEALELENEILHEGVTALFNDPTKGFYVVGEIDNNVVGCLMITYEWSDWRNGMFWWIQSVYVKKAYRRKGVFKTLYNYVKTIQVDQHEAIGLRLYVDSDNFNAQKTYRELGMQRTGYQLFEYISAKEMNH